MSVNDIVFGCPHTFGHGESYRCVLSLSLVKTHINLKNCISEAASRIKSHVRELNSFIFFFFIWLPHHTHTHTQTQYKRFISWRIHAEPLSACSSTNPCATQWQWMIPSSPLNSHTASPFKAASQIERPLVGNLSTYSVAMCSHCSPFHPLFYCFNCLTRLLKQAERAQKMHDAHVVFLRVHPEPEACLIGMHSLGTFREQTVIMRRHAAHENPLKQEFVFIAGFFSRCFSAQLSSVRLVVTLLRKQFWKWMSSVFDGGKVVAKLVLSL